MPLTKDSVYWTGKTVGVTIENYNDKWSIKSCRKYQKGGEEVITYDWIYVEEYDKETKSRKIATKPRPCSIYLGEKEQAIEALVAMLKQLGYNQDGETPF
jgi:hypothetical protein